MQINKISRTTLSAKFKVFFDKPLSPHLVWQVLPPKLTKTKSCWVYGIDGKWLRRNGVFLLHRNITTKENLYWSYWKSESYLALETDLRKLSKLLGDNLPSAAVSDWKGAIVGAVGAHFGSIPHQRCLSHVVRAAKRLLAKRSPFKATRLLRKIGCKLIHLRTEEEIVKWLMKLEKWHDRYQFMLKKKTIGINTKRKWWYTYGNLRRAWRLLTHSQKPFFKHLNRPLLPHSNNSLEGTISQAKNKLGDHRGMKVLQQVSFLVWYFTFTRVKNKKDLRKLWAVWKKENNKT